MHKNRLSAFWAGRTGFATIVVILCAATAVSSAFFAFREVRQQRYMQRGIVYQSPPPLPLPSDGLYGVNASLEQYSGQDLPRVLSMVREAGFTWVRQHFPWAAIEPQPGQYEWERWDRLVTETARQGLHLIAVLDTSPAWARRPVDRENRFAPPQFVTTYGLFARAFAQRYAQQITCYQVWDQPNIAPYWGAYNVDPAAYVRLLRVAYAEIKRADPGAIVLSAALAPNTESGGRNLSDVLFLRAMYQAGAKGHFDVLGAKAYGFWSGPDDRRVDPQVLNFSRLILLREELIRQGDASIPIWAVEFGWNALPDDWSGLPPPWGTDDATKQADRTFRAIQRARQEWAWLGVLCAAHLQPAVPANDPLWGFALLGVDSTPTIFYYTWQEAIATPVAHVQVDNTGYYARLALFVIVTLVAFVLLLFLWPHSSWGVWAHRLGVLYLSAPEPMQWALLGLLLLAYYWLPWTLPAMATLAAAGLLIVLRMDIGLAYLVLSIPFFLFPRIIFGKAFSMVETLTLLCFAAWLRQQALDSAWHEPHQRARAWLRSLNALDWAVIAFVLLAALSLFVSSNRGVSIREFRVIIIEPALLYFLLRQTKLTEKQLLRLADALLLAGVAVSAIGLYQYFGHGDVIVTEVVRRIHSVYASPNNLSLLLGRVIPLAIAMVVAGRSARRQVYGTALVPLILCLFLTYSRGGWLLALPAALLTIGLLRGRRTASIAALSVLICLLLLLPLLGTQRLVSLFDLEEGTTFRRLRLWQASVAMLRDHPLSGVGLDNFLYQYPNYMLNDAWQEPGLSHPHNLVLDWWLRLGIGGVVILAWLMVSFFRLALRLYRCLPDGDVRAIILGWMAGMAAVLAHGVIDNSYFLVDLAFIFCLTLGWVRAMQKGLNG